MQYGFHHIHLVCSSLEDTRAFFVDALGAEDGGVKFFGPAEGRKLDLDGVRVYLRGAKPEESREPGTGDLRFGYDHIGLKVPDVPRACDHLVGCGAVLMGEPRQTPSGWVAFLRGPDGIILELYDPVDDD